MQKYEALKPKKLYQLPRIVYKWILVFESKLNNPAISMYNFFVLLLSEKK
jgi:hypothetical protein